jgi:hypothetical protein
MPEFNNAGTFRKKTGTGTTTVYKMEFNNSGTVDIQTGTLKFDELGSGTHSGIFTIASGAKILSDYCTQNFSEGSEINGAGEFETVNYNNCNMSGTGNGTVIGSDITFKLSGNSTLNGDGKLSVNGTFEWTSTGFIEVEAFIISQGAKLNISGDNQKTFRAYPHGTNKIDNYGTITWTGTGAIGGYGPINNKSTGVIDIQNNATLDASSGSWTVINDGLIKKSAGTGTSQFTANLTNNGTLRIETGTLDLYVATLTNYDHNSGHPWLNGGVYDLQGKLKFNTSYGVPIEVNNAEIILDGSESGILLYNGSNALLNLADITSPGKLTLKNGRDFSSGAAAFTNYGTLDCGTNVFSNSGTFLNADYGCLIIASPDGISSSGSTGNIQSSGTRTFHTGGKYHYNGTSSQVTGDGLPATVRQLIIENSAGVTLSSSVTASTDLSLSEGALSTGSNTLTLGSSAESVGTLTRTNGKIIGNFKRWLAASTVDDVLFPMGTADNYRPVNVSYTSAPETGGTLTAAFTASNPGSNGLPLMEGSGYTVNTVSPDGYWSLSDADGLSGGTYDLDITAEGFGGIADYSALRILKRENSESAWTLDGSHVTGTVSNAIPVLHRSGLSGFSEFGVGGNEGDNSLLVILSSFTAKMVKGNVMLEWETSSEIENLGYIIRRHSIADGSPSIVIASFLTDDALKGQESTTKATKYSYVDKIVEPGKTYLYTLYDVNYEGRENRLKEIEIEIKAEGAMFADSYTLSPAYPNPFNPRTVIPLKLAAGADVHFSLYDINGHMIRELYRGYLAAGSYNLPIDGATLATGIYFVRIRINNSIHVQKISLMK